MGRVEFNDGAWVQVEAEVAKELTRRAVQVSGTAKRLCPVDTGRLRSSIDYEVDERALTARVGTNVEYAPYVELGTYKMAPRSFLRAALASVMGR